MEQKEPRFYSVSIFPLIDAEMHKFPQLNHWPLAARDGGQCRSPSAPSSRHMAEHKQEAGAYL